MLSVIPAGPVEGCMDCGSVEAGVGSIRTHLSTPPRTGPWRRSQGRRTESNWGRSVQSIDEEVGPGGQCGM